MMTTISIVTVIVIIILSINNIIYIKSQDLNTIADEVGGSFCTFLAYRSQIHRRYFNLCPKPTCSWDTWAQETEGMMITDTYHTSNHKRIDTSIQSNRVVLSYGHNGFGNQLWQHTIAFMIAESLKARLFISIIPESLSPNGVTPPNTFTGMAAMESLLPKQFLYEELPLNSSYRSICENEPFVLADRPIDWRDTKYTNEFKSNVYSLVKDKKPRCLKMLGYFQNLPLCVNDAKKFWTPLMFSNYTMKPGENDISIYLRCLPRHYYFNTPTFYENILNRTSHDRVWLFMAPECPSRLDPDPSRDGVVTSVLRLLYTRYNATKWPSIDSDDDTAHLLHDLSGLAQSKKLVIPVSSWGYWSGVLSSAIEVHVNAPPHHPLMNANMTQYIYHDEKNDKYFGQYNELENDIIYLLTDPTPTVYVSHHARQHSSHHGKFHNGTFIWESSSINGTSHASTIVDVGHSMLNHNMHNNHRAAGVNHNHASTGSTTTTVITNSSSSNSYSSYGSSNSTSTFTNAIKGVLYDIV